MDHEQQPTQDVVLDRIEDGLAWLFGGRGPGSTPRRERQTKTNQDGQEVTGRDRDR